MRQPFELEIPVELKFQNLQEKFGLLFGLQTKMLRVRFGSKIHTKLKEQTEALRQEIYNCLR